MVRSRDLVAHTHLALYQFGYGLIRLVRNHTVGKMSLDGGSYYKYQWNLPCFTISDLNLFLLAMNTTIPDSVKWLENFTNVTRVIYSYYDWYCNEQGFRNT